MEHLWTIFYQKNIFLFHIFQLHFLEEKHLRQTSIEEELRSIIKEKNKRIEDKSEEVSRKQTRPGTNPTKL
jgi:hypothetical protein